MRFYGLISGPRIERHCATGYSVRVYIPEDNIGIGNRRSIATSAITGRPRNGPGTHRTYPERTSIVSPGETPSSRTDFGDIIRRHTKGIASTLAQTTGYIDTCSDLAFCSLYGFTVFYQTSFRRGSAHIKGYDARE